MDIKYSLTNFLGKDKYVPVEVSKYDQIMMFTHFLRDIKNTSILDVFKVGFIEMRRRTISSSRSITTIDTIERDIAQYVFTLNKGKYAMEDLDNQIRNRCSDPNYRLYVFFMYTYFVSLDDSYVCNVYRQQILDIMLAYSTNRKYSPMIEFIFCALVSERQIPDGTANLKCSQYEDLNTIIKQFSYSRNKVLTDYETSTIDKPYIDSYMDMYSLALEYQAELESRYNFSILDFQE